MAWDEIKFKISADMDFGNALSQVANIKNGINELKGSIADMPNVSRVLDTSLEKTASIANSLSNKLVKLRSGNYKTNEERISLEKDIGNDVAELNTMRSLQTGNGDFSVSLAKSWFGGLPSAVQKELDSVIPQVSAIIRSRMNVLNGVNGNAFKGKTHHDIAAEAMADPEIQNIANKYLKAKVSKQQFKSLIEDLVPHVVAPNKLNAYQLRRYGSLITKDSAALAKGNAIDLFPESYKAAYKQHGYAKRQFSAAEGSSVLSKESVKELNKMLVNSPIMAKAAIASGIGRRDSRGVLETKREISRQDWENYRAALYDELVTRVAGYGKGKIDPYSSVESDVKKITSRLTSSTSGNAMVGMHNIEKFENKGAWSTGTGSKRYNKLYNESRRATDEYVVTKYSPFMRRADGLEALPREVMISESHNTRLLGKGQWKNNDDVSDTIALISLQGYDPKNKEQEKQLLDLYKNGKTINGKRYIAQSIHGKGDDQVVRMIEQSAYERVAAEEDAWAKLRKINGTYWRGFEDQEIERKIKSGQITAKDWGKHLEMQNKAWTPTTDIGLNLANKRVAVVDFQGKGDGATWFSSSVMPDSGQVRLGIGGKGSAFVFQGKNVGEFGRNAGIADSEGRVMMRGPDGKMFNVSDYDIIMPLDVIKNQGAYKDENGNFVSGERASEIATALVRRYGVGMAANYSKEDNVSRRIGTQMASFIDLSPELRDIQIQRAMARMQELDTESGQLKYVFGDQSDWLSRKVHEDRQLLSTEAAKRRVDAHKQSLMQKLIGGEYIDFGEGDSGISNMRLVANPLTSFLMSHGGITPEVISKARGYIKTDAEARGVAVPEYTNEEITNMIIPPKNTVLDFAHKDKNEVAVIRSPTGYGNMVHAKNLAAAAEPIYKGFRIPTDAGIYVSHEDLETLQGADYDADEAKVIYDEALRKSVEESLKTQHFAKPELPKEAMQYTADQLADMTAQQLGFSNRKAVMSPAMGTGSSGIRIRQLDLSKDSNKEFIAQAQRLAAYYDNWTTHDKNAEEMDIKVANAWNALKLGKEYTKFSDNIDTLFSFDDSQLDDAGQPDVTNPDVFVAKNGLKVNLKRLRDMGVDNINLPSAYLANHLMGVSEISNLYRSGLVQTNNMDAISEAMGALGYGEAEGQGGAARRRLMDTMRHLLPEFGTGQRTMLTPAETRAISAMQKAAEDELLLDSERYLDAATGKYMYNGQAYKSAKDVASAREKLFGINSARNAVGLFGMTEDRLKYLFGDDYSKRFVNSSVSDIELLPEDKLVNELNVQNENLETQIKDAQAAVNANKSKNKGKKSSKKLSVEQKALNKEIETIGKQLGITRQTNIDDAIAQYENAVEADQIVLDNLLEQGSNATEEQIKSAKDGLQFSRDKLAGYKNYKGLLQKKEDLAKAPEKKNLENLLAQKELLDQQRADAMKAVEMRSEYQSLLNAAEEYNSQLWAYQQGKANKIDESKTMADKYWNQDFYQAQEALAPLGDFEQKLQESNLSESTKQEMQNGMNVIREKINENMHKDFTNKAILYAKNVSDALTEDLNKEQNAPTAQKTKLDKYDEQIKNAKSFTSLMNKKLEDGKIDVKYQKLYEDAVKSANEFIESAENAKNQLIEEYTKKNEKNGRQAIDNLQVRFGVRRKNSAGVIAESRKEAIQNVRDTIDKQYKEGNYSKEEYEKASGELDKLESKATTVSVATQNVLNNVARTSDRIARRLGYQLFRKAIAEVKKFVQEYDKTLTTIQMITLKTNEEMTTLGDSLIDKAKELKVSISEISQSAATLYRQGLSDEEVSERLDVISKFSKVSGTKVDAATKLITVAMNTGLASDPEVAADIVTALGDNAATNAAEIEKGVEKAGAAAAADGTTFAELASMLTAITSTTQIGGNVAGRTLNTIFGRMNKIGTNELIYDENGNVISGSSVAKLLEEEGIALYENGKKKSSYNTLYELSQIWDGLSDAKQQRLATAIAGTRQYSNFAAIMQGMSEGKVSEYMDLASNAEGVVDDKYQIYVKSLEASLTDLKNTFDELVHDLTDKGILTGFIEGITGAIQGVDNLANSIGGLGATLSGVLPLLLAVTLLKNGNPIVGLSIGTLAMLGLNAAGSISTTKQDTTKINGVSANEYAKQGIELYSGDTKKVDSLIKDSKSLLEKNSRTEEENIQLQNNFTELSSMFSDLGVSIEDLSGSSDKAAKSLQTLADENENNKKKNTLQEIEDIRNAMQTEGSATLLTSSSDVIYLAKTIWNYNSEMPGNLWEDIQDPEKLKNIAYGISSYGNRGINIGEDFGQSSKLPLYALRQTYLGDAFGLSSDEDFSEVKDLISYFIKNGYYYEKDRTLQAMLSNPDSQGLTLDDILAGKTKGYFGQKYSDMFFERTAELFNDVYLGSISGIVNDNTEEIKQERQNVVKTYSSLLKDTLTSASGAPEEEVANALIKDFENSILAEGYENLPAETFFSLLTGKYEEFCDKVFADDGSVKDVEPISTIIKKEEDDGLLYSYGGKNGLSRSAAYELYYADYEKTKAGKTIPEIERYYSYGFGGKQNLTYEESENELHRAVFAAYAGEGVGRQGYYFSENDNHYEDIRDLYNEFESTALAMIGEAIANGDTSITAENYSEVLNKYKKQAVEQAISNGTIIPGTFVDEDGHEIFVPSSELDRWVDKRAEEDAWSRTGTPILEEKFRVGDKYNLTEEEAIAEQNRLKTEGMPTEPTSYHGSRVTSAINNAKANASASNQKKINADNFIKEVYGAGITDLQGLLQAVERGEISNFENVISELGLGDYLNNAYSYDPITGQITAFDEGGALFAKIMSSATGNSQSYAGINENAYISKAQHGLNVAKYLSNYKLEGKMTPLQDELNAVLGADLTSLLLDAELSDNEQNVNEEILKYAQTIAKNYSEGITGLKASDRLAGMKEIRAYSQKYGLSSYDENIAKQYLSSWSEADEYYALASKNAKTQEESDRLRELELALDNIIRNTEISIEIEGIKQLEEAGKLASGTADAIEKLRKGGKVALEVSIDVQNKAYSAGQTRAKLVNGSIQEQDEAIMSILGIDREQLYSNRDYYARQATRQEKLSREEQIASIYEEYKHSEPGVARKTLREAAAKLGYNINLKGYTDLGSPEINYSDYFAGQSKKYTDAELAAARQEIIAGNLTAESNNELYKAAVEGIGHYGFEYERLKYAKENNLSESQTEGFDKRLEEAQELAEQETKLAQEQADEADAIEKARLNATTVEGASRYAQLRYQQTNKAGLAANTLVETFNSDKYKTAEDVLNAFAQEDVKKNWTDLLEATPELVDEFKKAGHAVSDDGTINWDAIQSQEGNLDNALADLVAIIAKHSKDFAMIDTYDTNADIYTNANKFINGEITEDNYNAFSSIVGSDLASRYAATDYYNVGHVSDVEQEYIDQLLSNYSNGIVGLTKSQQAQGAQKLFDAAQAGQEVYQSTYGNVSQDMINAYTEATPLLKEYVDAVKEGTLNEGELKEMAKDVQAEIAGINAEAKGYGESAKKASEFAKAISKGGTAADKAKISLEAQMMSIQDQQTAIEKAAGKSGKDLKKMAGKGDRTLEILSGMFDFSADQIANMSKEKIQELIDKAGPMIAEQFSDVVDGLYQSLPEGVDVNLPISDLINVHTDGSIDLSELESVLDKAAVDIIAEILTLARQYGAIDLEAELNNKTLTVEGLFRAISSAGAKPSSKGYSGGKSNSGGGGKSETDKLLERQKQRTAEYEHQSKLLEIQEKYYDFVNDYSGHTGNINEQISAQESLRSAYAQNLSELRAQLGAVEQGSDDYNKLADAIRSAEEAMASIGNTINELNAKKIQIVATKQENEDKPLSHQLSMLQKYAARYQTTGQFESYANIMEKTIEETKNQITQNNGQIREWENLLTTYEENSDSWIEVRDKIWALREENAELENQVASDTISLQEAKISQIAQDLQNTTLGAQHENNVLDTFGQIYQSVNNQEGYRRVLADTNENNQRLKEQTDAAIEQIKKEIDEMEATDPARQTAIQTLYELEETSAQYEASMLQNRQAIEESLINELTQGHSDATSVLEHEMKLLSEAEKAFTRDDDFVNYENILQEEARNAALRLTEQERALEDYLELQQSGQITEGSQQWRELEDTIRSTKENMAGLSNEYEELIDKLQNARFENLQKTFTEADDLAQHNLRMIQYEETRYQNRGELTNYGTLLSQDTDMQRERAASITQYLENLRAQQEEVKDNPQLFNKITSEIYKWEESLSQINNQIEKNTDLMKKNEEAIRKARQAVENVIDKEIRERIQKEKDMLAATVQVENSIIEAIKKRYTDEWNLQKKDIDKKKQALNEEKNLINERLNAKKEAIAQEEKYEELAEYKRQLALISADTTRTKDAAELRRQIQDLEKDLSWETVQDEANFQIETIDNSIKAYDEYVSAREEDLNEYLSDKNNFTDEVQKVMGSDFKTYAEYMRNTEAYKKSTAEERQQTEQGWLDLWQKMKGELNSYWEEVDETMRTRENFIAYMMGSDSYSQVASESGRQSLVAYWEDLYDNYTASLIDNADFDHTHEITDKIDELKDWVFNVNLIGLEDYDIDSVYSMYDYFRKHNVEEYTPDSDYKGVGKKYEEPVSTYVPSAESTADTGSGSTSGNGNPVVGYVYIDASETIHKKHVKYKDGSMKFVCNEDHTFVDGVCKKCGHKKKADNTKYVDTKTITGYTTRYNEKFAEGGLVNYTGPAWVDGTPSHPESFLDATDTELLRNMLDAFTYVKTSPTITRLDQSNFGKGNVNVGDVNVNLYEAKLESNADYDVIAEKVGKAFTKQLQKDGFNLAGYAW